MANQLIERRKTHFVLWRPAATTPAPRLVIGVLVNGNPPTFSQRALRPLALGAFPDLWELRASDLRLPEGVYHYWFIIGNDESQRYTDPFAYTVDYRLLGDGLQPASVISISGDHLVPCDPGGEIAKIGDPPKLVSLPPNNQMVIYELPPSWSRAGVEGADPEERDVGTFRDVVALIDRNSPGANFSDLPEVADGQHLIDLGINALECLPVADTKSRREWGYATAHYLAPDADLGTPEGNQSPTAASDLTELVRVCHSKGIRFITDVVMAFGHDPCIEISYPDFHIHPKDEPSNPDSYQSSRDKEFRDGFGGESWRYIKQVEGYDPETGTAAAVQPAWSFMFTFLERWMTDFCVDGLRLDSVNNIANWDFLKLFKDKARTLFSARYPAEPAGAKDARFLVVNEELNLPFDLLNTHTADALWNENFRRRVKAAIVGESESDNFEWTVRKMVDCRLLGFADGAQAINYITSHDTEGYRNERLYNFLENMNVYDKERRAKLAYACLLTSVGAPMIFAGEEFCDQQDRPAVSPSKQIDPLNLARMRDPWRQNVFWYVANLIRFRIRSIALGVNDTNFIHFDFDYGRRIAAWVRGRPGIDDLVVVVANFSDQVTPGPEYIVNNWPATPAGQKWREISQGREVPLEWVGKEPLFAWEAKVYEMYG